MPKNLSRIGVRIEDRVYGWIKGWRVYDCSQTGPQFCCGQAVIPGFEEREVLESLSLRLNGCRDPSTVSEEAGEA